MRVAKVIGSLTLSKWHPSLSGATWLMAAPLARDDLGQDGAASGEPIVVYDELGASTESLIACSDGAEAAAPFYPDTKPIDAYNAAILDHIDC